MDDTHDSSESPAEDPSESPTPARSVDARLHVRVQGETHEIPVAANQTLLSAVRDAGLQPPFSCQKGVCGACLAKLVFGEVDQHHTGALDPDQIDDRWILTCQSVATTEIVAIDYL